MGLFGFGKKKEESCCNVSSDSLKAAVETACDCGGACGDKATDDAVIKVLGSGCKKCNDLEKAIHDALKNMGKDVKVSHVTDFAQIAAYGVMTTPAMMVHDKVVSTGKVLKPSEVEKLLTGVI